MNINPSQNLEEKLSCNFACPSKQLLKNQDTTRALSFVINQSSFSNFVPYVVRLWTALFGKGGETIAK